MKGCDFLKDSVAPVPGRRAGGMESWKPCSCHWSKVFPCEFTIIVQKAQKTGNDWARGISCWGLPPPWLPGRQLSAAVCPRDFYVCHDVIKVPHFSKNKDFRKTQFPAEERPAQWRAISAPHPLWTMESVPSHRAVVPNLPNTGTFQYSSLCYGEPQS